MTPCGPAETSIPLSGLKNVIRGYRPAPEGSGSGFQVCPRSWLVRKYGAAGRCPMTTNAVRPKNCGGLYTSQPLEQKALAGTGSGCGAHRAPPSRVTSSTSGDSPVQALVSQPACAVAKASPALSQ